MDKSVTLKKHRITVLLIDDQAIIGEAMRRMFVDQDDIDFHYCQDATKAIKTANTTKPTVILQDLVMPEIEGLTLVRYFRANHATNDVPLIVLSGKEEPRTKAEAFALGANDYMVKLPDKLEVLARIRYHSKGYINLLERNDAQKQLEVRNRFIRETFGRYLSDEIVENILESPEGMKLGGEKRKLTIMMTDLRGFTSISERLPAENVVSIINNYLEVMIEIIFKYHGTIDEFIGDAILVLFGAPITRDNDAERAVACAMEMQIAMQEVNARNRKAGFPDVAQGIGINTGNSVVGNIGSVKRSKYGVVGKNVNLTSRIESCTIGGQTFISESTLKSCRSILQVDNQIEVMLKGLKEPVFIYEIGGIGGEYNLYLPPEDIVDLIDLPQGIQIEFATLDGKRSDGATTKGRIIKLNPQSAHIESTHLINNLSNLKISIFDHDHDDPVTTELYAKVTKEISTKPAVFQVNFTSVPPELKNYFNNLKTGEY